MAAPPARKDSGRLATNRKALRDYFVLERIEAGLELTGPEVKSVRAGGANLTGGYARIDEGDATLLDVHIAPYAWGNRFNPDPARPRRLLLHAKEISRLEGHLAQKGLTLVPLSVYLHKRWIKVELGLCRGRQDPDKREHLRQKTAEQEARRAIARQR